MEINDIIKLERVKLLEETEEDYKIKYGSEIYNIFKDSKTGFEINQPTSQKSKLELRLEQKLVPETHIFIDETAPLEFKEVMLFHEFREIQYKENGFEDAHQRAINDEILYIMKFFDEKKQKEYLNFAEDYRKQAPKREIINYLKEKQAKYLDSKNPLDLNLVTKRELGKHLCENIGYIPNLKIYLNNLIKNLTFLNGEKEFSANELIISEKKILGMKVSYALKQLQQNSSFYKNGKWIYIDYQLSHFLKEKFGIDVASRTVDKYLKKMGKNMRHHGWSEDEKEYLKELVCDDRFLHPLKNKPKYMKGKAYAPDYNKIANEINDKFHEGYGVRTAEAVKVKC